MRILNFIVDGQKLMKSGDFSDIVRGSKGYLMAHFEFQNGEWNRHKIVAVFIDGKEEHAVIVNNNGMCNIPDNVTNNKCIKLKLVGALEDKRIITNCVLIEQM